jgi:hypothetical protein
MLNHSSEVKLFCYFDVMVGDEIKLVERNGYFIADYFFELIKY